MVIFALILLFWHNILRRQQIQNGNIFISKSVLGAKKNATVIGQK